MGILQNCENRNDPDLVQAFLQKWWVESDFKAPNLVEGFPQLDLNHFILVDVQPGLQDDGFPLLHLDHSDLAEVMNLSVPGYSTCR